MIFLVSKFKFEKEKKEHKMCDLVPKMCGLKDRKDIPPLAGAQHREGK